MPFALFAENWHAVPQRGIAVHSRADATRTGAVGGGEFDIVSCSFGLSDIDDPDGAVAVIGGRCIAAGDSPSASCIRALPVVRKSQDPGRQPFRVMPGLLPNRFHDRP